MALITVPTAEPTHTNDKCETCDGLTSFTANPDDKNSTEGVSLKNALTPTIDDILSPDFLPPNGYHWYFLRVNYNRAKQFYDELKDQMNGYLLWMPCQKIIKYNDGQKIERLQPIFKSNIFIYATEKVAYELTHRSANGYPFVDFMFDHTNKNQYGRDNILTIPFHEMLSFIRAENIHHPWAHVVEAEKIRFREGGLVRVTGGSFEGVIGHVARVYGQTRVVVTIKGIVNYATAYISQKYLQPIEESNTDDSKPEAGNSIRNRIKRHELKVGNLIPETKNQNK